MYSNWIIGSCRSVLIVGSYARGTNKENSDLDILEL
ncbi:MAG: nucleotidyltransferase domain-containing protein [Acetatifactor sp.]